MEREIIPEIKIPQPKLPERLPEIKNPYDEKLLFYFKFIAIGVWAIVGVLALHFWRI